MTQITDISTPRTGETSVLWLIKIATGPLLVLVLILHLVVNHFIGEVSGLMTYEQIVEFYRNPIIPTIEIIFLVTVITHSLLGTRSIILDMNPPRPLLGTITWVLGLIGLAFTIYGIWLAIAIASAGG